MKMAKLIALILAVSVLWCSVAFASVKTAAGTTSGTPSTSCSAALHYFNIDSNGNDYTYAVMQALKAGSLGASATLYYKTAAGASSSVTKYATGSTSATTAKAYGPTGSNAYQAKGNFTYSSSTYGSWSKTLYADM